MMDAQIQADVFDRGGGRREEHRFFVGRSDFGGLPDQGHAAFAEDALEIGKGKRGVEAGDGFEFVQCATGVAQPRPLIMGTASPPAATMGAKIREVLSPTPPVECLSTFLAGDRSDRRLRGMQLASVARRVSARERPRSQEAISHAASPAKKVDKHSTGGVGDKTSLILAPIVAAGGLAVPMISGRGLGHTGGTLDKLEAIPGFNTSLTLADFKRVLRECGMALIGQTPEIARRQKNYALATPPPRSKTIGLICASIMSKKLAEGIDALVLDVKNRFRRFHA